MPFFQAPLLPLTLSCPLLIPWPPCCRAEWQPRDLMQLHTTTSLPPPVFSFLPRGEVTWDCVKTQLSEAARWTWLCLQDITVAFLDWALATISQQ